MGLDTVELIMEVEESFGIGIPDAEAERIRTVGELYRHVLAKLGDPMRGTPGCLSAAAFYRLRRQLMSGFRIERRRIRPGSAMDDLIPKSKRGAAWQRLGEGLGWRLPALVRPGRVRYAFLVIFLTWSAIVIFAWGRLTGFALEAAVAHLFVLGAGTVLLGIAVYQLTRPLVTGFPSPDIRGILPMILVANFGTFRINNRQGWNDHDVWEALRTIVAEQAGVAPDQLTDSTSFVNDLGLD
jgi:acyl carrier protein